MTSRETLFVAFVMRGFAIGTIACLAIWGAHCLASPLPRPPPATEDAGIGGIDATLDTSHPLPEPEEGAEAYADSAEVDCSAWPDETGDYGPPSCWPQPDTPPWQNIGHPSPGPGHLAQ